MKWGFKAHKALIKYGHHKEGLDNSGWRFPSVGLKGIHLLMQDDVMGDGLFVGCQIWGGEKLKLTILYLQLSPLVAHPCRQR